MTTKNLKNFNKIPFVKSAKNIEIVKKIYAKMSFIRHFELWAFNYRKAGKFQTLIYLCLGQESIYASVAVAIKKAYVFGQHRGHGIYLSYNGVVSKLIDEILGLPSGTNKGMGGSPPIFDTKIGMYGHVGLIGDQVPVSAGFSLVKSDRVTICYFGDGAAEEDYVLATFGFVSKNKLRVLFICDDNDFSVLTKTKVRRNWKLTDVAKSFGIKSYDITDDPFTIYQTIKKLKKNDFPSLINIRTCREYWHEGAGKDITEPGQWNRFDILTKEFNEMGLKSFVKKENNKNNKNMKLLWEKQLQKQ